MVRWKTKADDVEKEIWAISLVGSEPLHWQFYGMASLLCLSLYFHTTNEYHLELLLWFYGDTLQDLADYGIAIGERVAIHAVENGVDIVQPGGGILPVLLGGSALRQSLFRLVFLRHQLRNAGIG